MSCKGEQRARGDIKQEVRRDEIVWVYRRNSMAQRDKGVVKRYMVRRTGKHSKRGG